MKAEDYLENIRKMDARISTTIEELREMETIATKTTSVLGGERVQSSGSKQKMENCVVKIVELKDKLSREIEAIIECKREARQLIADSCDAKSQLVLHKRYFEHKRWSEIAYELDYSEKYVSGSMHQRALTQLQKALDQMEEE